MAPNKKIDKRKFNKGAEPKDPLEKSTNVTFYIKKKDLDVVTLPVAREVAKKAVENKIKDIQKKHNTN